MYDLFGYKYCIYVNTIHDDCIYSRIKLFSKIFIAIAKQLLFFISHPGRGLEYGIPAGSAICVYQGWITYKECRCKQLTSQAVISVPAERVFGIEVSVNRQRCTPAAAGTASGEITAICTFSRNTARVEGSQRSEEIIIIPNIEKWIPSHVARTSTSHVRAGIHLAVIGDDHFRYSRRASGTSASVG